MKEKFYQKTSRLLYLLLLTAGHFFPTKISGQTISAATSLENANQLIQVGKYDSAEVVLLEIMQRTAVAYPAEHLQAALLLSENYITTRKQKFALEVLWHARHYFQVQRPEFSAPEPIRARLLLQYGDLGLASADRSLRPRALQLYRQAVQLAPEDSLLQGILARKIGRVLRLLNQNDEVIPAYMRSLALLKSRNCREYLRTLQELGIYHYKLRDSARARYYLEEVDACLHTQCCPNFRIEDQLIQYYYRGKIQQIFHDNSAGAQATFVQAVTLCQNFSCYSSLLPYLYDALGNLQFEQAEFEAARQTYLAYLDYHAHVSGDSVRIGRAYGYLGDCLLELGDSQAAKRYYDEQFKVYHKVPPHPKRWPICTTITAPS